LATDGHELQRQGVGQELEESLPAEEVEQEGQKSMTRPVLSFILFFTVKFIGMEVF
jgi:hypothetical protein